MTEEWQMIPRFESGFRTLRDVLLFVMGSGVVAHEVLIASTERWSIIILGAALLGMPTILAKDEKKQ